MADTVVVRLRSAGSTPKLHVLIGQAQKYTVDVALTMPIESVFSSSSLSPDQRTGTHDIPLRPPADLHERMLHLSALVHAGIGNLFSVEAWIVQDGVEIAGSRQKLAGPAVNVTVVVTFNWWLEVA